MILSYGALGKIVLITRIYHPYFQIRSVEFHTDEPCARLISTWTCPRGRRPRWDRKPKIWDWNISKTHILLDFFDMFWYFLAFFLMILLVEVVWEMFSVLFFVINQDGPSAGVTMTSALLLDLFWTDPFWLCLSLSFVFWPLFWTGLFFSYSSVNHV